MPKLKKHGITSREMAAIIEKDMCPRCFALLLDRLGGQMWHVPVLAFYAKERIQREIWRLWTEENWSMRRISVMYKLSNSRVSQIIHRIKNKDLIWKPDPKKEELFKKGEKYGTA